MPNPGFQLRATSDRRSGVVLLIVMAMLALFAVVGLSFVFYADSTAEAARFRRQGENVDLADAPPEKLFSYALGQLIFDTDNPRSKMHGHSLGRSLYGSPGGTIAFSGLGRPHPDTVQTLAELTPFDGINVPYTYPDINNPFLAALDPENPGFLKERSFFRNGASLRPSTLPPHAEGDVRNIDSLDGITHPTNPASKLYNDAFWMDLDYPITTAKDGMRFKPLFAFSVLDLDGRLNLAVSGNYQADYARPGTTSRCGLGTWEINPARVLTIDKSEIANLFRGNGAIAGRFGDDNMPDNAVRFPSAAAFARVDFTGLSASTAGRSTAAYSQYPIYGDWGNLGFNNTFHYFAASPVVHASGFDYFGARARAGPAEDQKLAPSNAEAILRWRERGAPALTSDLIRLLPNNLNPQAQGSAPIFNRITPYSMSLDTAHLAPFVAGQTGAIFQWQPGDPTPKSATMTQRAPKEFRAGDGEYTSQSRSRVAALWPRINLNRNGGVSEVWYSHVPDLSDIAPFSKELAKTIFDRLVQVTGALPPTQGPPFRPADPTDPRYKATRWLAQYAVNLADFIDDDEEMTPFQWIPNSTPTEADYVFGVETVPLLINEAYASADNDPADVQGTNNGKKYRVNVWAELYNPLRNLDSDRITLGLAVLGDGKVTNYRLLLVRDSEGIADSPTGSPKNYFYDRNDPALGVGDWPELLSTVRGGDQKSGSMSSQGSDDGFYLVGPPNRFIQGRQPSWSDASSKTFHWNHLSAGMQSGLKDMPLDYGSLSNLKATLVLQRVARPSQAPNNNPADVLHYNPYVTIDVFPDIPVNNSVRYFGTKDQAPPPLNTFQSVGRDQPMQRTGVKPQSSQKPANEPRHTFCRQNTPGRSRFDAVYHFDRALVSTAEALLVAAAPPWEVTQRFANPQAPLAAWSAFQNEPLLSRFLETVTTGDRAFNRQLLPYYKDLPKLTVSQNKAPSDFNHLGTGKQAIVVPGKINLNTVSDEKVLQALFDRQSNSVFTDDDVHQFWLDLLEVRKSRGIAGFSDYTFDRNTRAVTLHNTLLGNLFKKMSDRAAKAGANEFEASEGLRKVMNNITFTSNAFAVWVTTGFFEVDAAGSPIQEIGKNENRNVRHRMFAVVDRSQLVVPAPAQSQSFTTMAGASAKGATNATLAAMSGFLRSQDPSVKVDFPWQIKAGTALTIDRGQPTEETVIVQSVSGNQIQVAGAGFLQQHNAGASVDLAGIQGPQVPLNRAPDATTVPNFMLGYPGPQPQFNLREYAYVVPYYNIID